MKFKYLTAPLYAGLLPSEVLRMDITETKATCESCLMARAPTALKERYENHLKCCTYYPLVPNFAVGAVLADTGGRYSHAQKVIRDLIQKRQYALPIGLLAPVRYQLEFKKRQKGEFGRIEEWLCPYFHKEKNQCSMWAYRGAVCTSFYCQSSFGRRGQKYWSQISDYLTYVEMALLEEALIRLDFSPRQISESLHYLNREDGTAQEKKSWVLPEKVARRFWRDYYSDQEGFFIKCFDIVSGFDKRAFKEMMGEQGQQIQNQLLSVYENLHFSEQNGNKP
jgi:hypothetical protein